MDSYRAVNPQFADWEDRINKAFTRVGRRERVCLHSDRTITPDPFSTGHQLVECDYCPARVERLGNDVTLTPHYYLTD